MEDTFSLLGVKAENLSAKEAMKRFFALLNKEGLSIIRTQNLQFNKDKFEDIVSI